METQTFWDGADIEELNVERIYSEDLTALADHYLSDKGTKYGPAHGYSKFYQSQFATLRNHSLRLLEIGIARGSSLKMWASWFTKGNIVGLDINSNCKKLCKNFSNIDIVIGDAKTFDFGDERFDIVIDDGSHLVGDIIETWQNIKRNLHRDSVYVIEDIHSTIDIPYISEFHDARAPHLSMDQWREENSRSRLNQFLLELSIDYDVSVFEEKIAFIRHRGSIVDRGDGVTFSFGENWLDFHGSLNEEVIGGAVADIRDWLPEEELVGKSVIDVGSGSGLSSLALMRCGAASITSIDVDPKSVLATRKLAEASSGASWNVREGSILDDRFVNELGQFDLVYSWGVLHHTGAMWGAIENATRLCKDGGLFWIAIYAGGHKYQADLALKQRYNAADQPTRDQMIDFEIEEYKKELASQGKDPEQWNHQKERGMNIRNDIVDWLGGLPYEVARVSEIVTFGSQRRFVPLRVLESPQGGCSIFLFRKSSTHTSCDPDTCFKYGNTWSSFVVQRTLLQQIIAEFAQCDALLESTKASYDAQLSTWVTHATQLEGKVASGSFLSRQVWLWGKRKLGL
ncbi:MAG TPA: hypothetical protein DDZ51_04600 [Planctomycetaceae bacterium]|nr:hypothetical protein [Planctomycetaceae bacterium]